MTKTIEEQKRTAANVWWDEGIGPAPTGSDIRNLVETITLQLYDSPMIVDALTACDLQPTLRATWLAASSAVHVLLAHELGQQVARDVEGDDVQAEA
jgi:hypothetical protein